MYETMLLLTVAVYFGVVAFYLRSGLASLYHPLTLYLAFHGFVFVLRPIIVDLAGYDYVYHVYQFRPSLEDKLTVLGATNLGLLSFAWFSMRSGNVPMTFKSGPAHDAERKLIRRVLPWMLAICVPIGVYSLYRATNVAVTGENSMIMKDNIRVNTTDVGYLTEAMLMLVPVTALIAWYWRFTLYSLAPLALFFVIKAASGGRGPFVVAAFATALFFFYDRKIKLPSARILAFALAVGFVFNAIGTDRGYALREALGFENQTVRYSSEGLRPLEGQDFANLEYFEYIVYVIPQRSGTYDYFLNNLQLLTEPIPRVLWPGKPAGAPIKTIDWFRYGQPLGMTSSLPGLGWTQLGWLGVAFWCGLWGWALGRFYRWFAGGDQDAIKISTYLVFYSLLIIGFRDGGLITIFRQGLFLLLPIGLLVLVRRFKGVPTLAMIRLALARQAQGPTRAMRARQATRVAEADAPTLAAPSASSVPRSVRRRLALGKPA